MATFLDRSVGKAGRPPARKEAQRDEIFREFEPTIKILAHQLAARLPPHMEMGDLESAGAIGLMDAMTKFDPSRGVKLKTYAVIRIRGAMMDESRANDWLPRWVYERNARLEKTQRALSTRYGRPPTDSEMAPALGISVSEVGRYLSGARRPTMLSLEDLAFEKGDGSRRPNPLIDYKHPGPLATVLAKNQREILAGVIDLLPRRERVVLTLYYYEELKMREIGTILNVTLSRVCQIHAKAITDLRVRLQWVALGPFGPSH